VIDATRCAFAFVPEYAPRGLCAGGRREAQHFERPIRFKF
jgi:hypothetical protein